MGYLDDIRYELDWNIIDSMPLESFEGFSVKVEDIDAGWMDIFVTSPTKTYDYQASYITDPMEELLEAVARLLTHQPTHSRTDLGSFENFAFIKHDLEGDMVSWAMFYEKDVFTLCLFPDMSRDEIDDLYRAKFCYMRYKDIAYEKPPDLKAELIMGMRGKPHLFVKALIKTFEDIDKDFPDKEVYDWGGVYNVDNLEILKKWLREHPLDEK